MKSWKKSKTIKVLILMALGGLIWFYGYLFGESPNWDKIMDVIEKIEPVLTWFAILFSRTGTLTK